MATNSVTTLEIGDAELPLVSRLYATCADCWSLTKPEVNSLILITTVAGFYLGRPSDLPPFPLQQLIGWAASSGSIGSKAWILYAVLFLWQFPHFMSIVWMYREDYARAGYRLLPNSGGESFMAWFTLAPSLALLVVNLTAVAAD